MLFEDVDPHHSLVELWIQRLDDFIVEMLLQMFKKKKKRYEMVCAHNANIPSLAQTGFLGSLPDTAEHRSL